jgi:hypothetical protein
MLSLQKPAVAMPDQLAEVDSSIYCQVRTYHYLKHALPPTSALLQESGWATTLYAAHRDRAGPYAAVAAAAAAASAAEAVGSSDAPAAASAAALTEVASVLYSAVSSVAAGTKHCPDYGPLLPCEYEVTVPKVDNSLYMNIAEGPQGGVRVDTFRALPDGSEAPVQADGRVRKGHIITAINGRCCEGVPFEQAIQHLREAPSYVTLRLTADIGERNKLKQQQAVLEASKVAEEARERAAAGAKDPAWPPAGLPASVLTAATAAAADADTATAAAAAALQRPADPVSDSDSEDDYDLMPEEGLRGLIRTMAPKRRLLLAASEAAEPPEDALWQHDIFGVLAHAHAAAAAAAAGASQQRSRALRKPVDQFDPATGQLVQRWDSLTSASKGLNIPICSISNCMRGQAEHAGGWKFRAAAVVASAAAAMSSLPLVNMQGLPEGAARLMAKYYGAVLPRDDDTDVVVVSSSSSSIATVAACLVSLSACWR